MNVCRIVVSYVGLVEIIYGVIGTTTAATTNITVATAIA
jgi:hypothetical protein